MYFQPFSRNASWATEGKYTGANAAILTAAKKLAPMISTHKKLFLTEVDIGFPRNWDRPEKANTTSILAHPGGPGRRFFQGIKVQAGGRSSILAQMGEGIFE
jgi:hypothetical protein